jgi:hypothetical protein
LVKNEAALVGKIVPKFRGYFLCLMRQQIDREMAKKVDTEVAA